MKKIFNVFAVVLALILTASCAKGDFSPDAFVGMAGEDSAAQQGGDKYDDFLDNPFIKTAEQNVSTFSVDADGASYANMRRYVISNQLPPAASVRVEEFLNYFTFDYPEPTDGNELALNAEAAVCPWNTAHRLIRLGIKGKSIEESKLPDANFVFLIDVSGSMNSSDKLTLLKSGLKTLVDQLRPSDRISIITYSGTVKKVLESTLVAESAVIKNAISKLVASGSTAGGEAMKMAYQEALDNYIEGGNNRVIMGTDGDFNVGISKNEDLVEMVQDYASKGVYLTVCGFGRGNLNDSMMESISNHGNGNYEYIGFEDDLTKVFVNERSEFFALANDTKIQLTFDKDRVESYRLIGYENRVLSNEDFENDEKDAAEVGSGQTITALYEVVPASEGAADKEALAVFDVRYKKSLDGASVPLSMKVMPVSKPSNEFNFAAGIAAYGMILRSSPYKGEADMKMAIELAKDGLYYDEFGYRADFLNILSAAEKLME